MTNPHEQATDLSDRLLLLSNTFRKAKDGYLEFDHQAAKTFLALLNESYEDALLLEAALANGKRIAAAPTATGNVISFPRVHIRPHVIEGDDAPGGGAA